MKVLLSALFLFVVTAAEGAGIRFYYTANRQGEVEPCGCAVNQLGGLHRLENFLALEAKVPGATKDALFVDAGDTFFVSQALTPSRKDQELLRAKLIAEAYRKFGLAALSPGERDFAAGLDKLKELASVAGTTLVSANLMGDGGKPLFETRRVQAVGNVTVGITGAADEESFANVPGVKALPAVPALKEAVSALRREGATIVVVLSHLGLPADRELAKAVDGIDFIFGSHSLDVLAEPVVVGKTAIYQPQIQGQQIGVVDVNGSGASKHRLVDLGKDFEADNEMAKKLEAYKKQVRELALADSAVAAPPTGDRPFVAHPRECRTCHQKQHDFWESTKHASAYLVLFAKNQHFDPECIGCHSLGFEQPGGFSKIASPITLENPEKKKKKKSLPFVEELMKRVFVGEKGEKALDSRTEPERYGKLKKRYHDEMALLEEAGKIRRAHLGVQCEHCHGNRHGHPSPEVKTVKKVMEASCKECHHPPHDNAFNFTERVKQIACPLSGKEG